MAIPVKFIPPSFGIKNLSSLLLPAKNHLYFSQADQYPFEPIAETHSVVNAWWLAECSLLAYEDKENVQKILSSVQDLELEGFTWFEADNQNKTVGTTGFGFKTADFAVICFRGTEFYSPQDIVQQLNRLMQMAKSTWVDVQISLKAHTEQEPIFDEPVHTGFYKGLASVWKQVNEFVDSVGDKPIWLTGHSLGAAISTLLAYQYPNKIKGLYTYGSPCVGAIEFVEKFEQMTVAKQSFRHQHGKDFATKILTDYFKKKGYEHVGTLKTLPAEKVKYHHWFDGISDMLAPTSLAHHAPLYYALHTWNNIPTIE